MPTPLLLEFVSSRVTDIHVDSGRTHPAPDRWDVDAVETDGSTLLVIGRLGFTRSPKQYRAGGFALFECAEGSASTLDQTLLAGFVRGPAARLLYSFLGGPLNTVAGIVEESQQFPVETPVPPRLLRRSEGAWRVLTVDEVDEGALVI